MAAGVWWTGVTPEPHLCGSHMCMGALCARSAGSDQLAYHQLQQNVPRTAESTWVVMSLATGMALESARFKISLGVPALPTPVPAT